MGAGDFVVLSQLAALWRQFDHCGAKTGKTFVRPRRSNLCSQARDGDQVLEEIDRVKRTTMNGQ